MLNKYPPVSERTIKYSNHRYGVVILLCLTGSTREVFFILNFAGMEGAPDQLPPQPDPIAAQQRQVEAASDFLSICDRLSTGYDSGYYWEDVQRALRIAAGLEKWPD